MNAASIIYSIITCALAIALVFTVVRIIFKVYHNHSFSNILIAILALLIILAFALIPLLISIESVITISFDSSFFHVRHMGTEVARIVDSLQSREFYRMSDFVSPLIAIVLSNIILHKR